MEENLDSLKSVKFKAGNLVLNYLLDEEEQDNDSFKSTKRRRGRPKKAKKDKSEMVILSLPPKYLSFIDKFAKKDKANRPRRSLFIRDLIREYLKCRKREREQLRIFRIKIEELRPLLAQYGLSKTSNNPPNSKNQKRVEGEMIAKMMEIQTLYHLYQFDFKTLSRYLTEKQLRDLRFSLFYLNENENNLPS